MKRSIRFASLFLAASVALSGCSNGSSPSESGQVIVDPPTGSTSTIKLTIKTVIPDANASGDIFVRWGTAAFTRSQFTFQDNACVSGMGPKTCTFNVPKGQLITIAVNDQQADPQIFAIVFNAQNQDPRGIRSQFATFEGNCQPPLVAALCVLNTAGDQTLVVTYKPLHWTRINFVGSAGWKMTVTSPPTYGIAGNIKLGPITLVATPGNNFLAGEVPQCSTTALTPTHCFSIITPDETPITFEAVPPLASTKPPTSPGPINLVSYDSGCNASNPVCALKVNVDQTLNVKWEYYVCANPAFTTNPIWKLSPPELAASGCSLRQP